MASSAPTASQALAARIAGLRWDRLPAEVRQMSRRVILDAPGCALHGSRTPEAGLLAAARADLGPEGACTVWDHPLSDGQLRAKFLALAGAALGPPPGAPPTWWASSSAPARSGSC